MTDFLLKNVRKIRAGVEDHNETCKVPARAILLHPDEHDRLGVSDLWDLPLLADARQRIGFFRVDCEGSAWQIESELAAHVDFSAGDQPAPELPESPVERPLAARGISEVATRRATSTASEHL